MTTASNDNSRGPDCLSDFTIDQWMADELSPEQRAAADAHVQTCADCKARITTIEAETAAFLSQAPTLAVHGELIRELESARRKVARNRALLTLSSGIVLAAVVSLVIFPRPPLESEPAGTRTKGSAHIDFFIKRGEQVTPGASGDTVHPGDLLRFTYTSRQNAQLALINIDRQRATVYYPSEGETSAPVTQGEKRALDFSVELDQQLGTERIYAVFCREPFQLVDVIQSLTGPQPNPPDDCTLDTITLEKAPLP